MKASSAVVRFSSAVRRAGVRVVSIPGAPFFENPDDVKSTEDAGVDDLDPSALPESSVWSDDPDQSSADAVRSLVTLLDSHALASGSTRATGTLV